MQFKTLNDILLTYTEPSSGSCEKCSYLPNKKIKPNSFYLTCKQKIVKDIHYPDILVFIFDLSDENSFDEEQYNNLINLKENYKHLIVEEFFLIDNLYRLIGTINQKTINHYTNSIINNIYKDNKLALNRSHY